MNIPPLWKQCFVTTGASLNMMANAMTVAFGSVLLVQFPMDDDSASWILSVIGIALIAGILTVPIIIQTLGRRIANLLAAVIMVIGWLWMVMSNSFLSIFLSRFIQGFSSGFTGILAAILIGEYTSPKHRGALLATLPFSVSVGVLVAHSLGSLLNWQTAGIVCTIVPFLNIFVILNSPESPSYLATKGKYDECRKAFHWLREEDEKDELDKLIKADMIRRETHKRDTSENIFMKIKRKFAFMKQTTKKKEFYKPILLMLHLHTINEWGGSTFLDSYASDVYPMIIGNDVNIPLIIASTDIHRIVTGAIAIIIIKKIRRKIMLLITILICISSYLLTACYMYAKIKGVLPYDHPMVGILLLHLHTFSIASGTLTLPNVISGEIFPLRYRNLGGVICLCYYSVNVFVNVKTVPFLFKTIGLHGAYCLYAGIMSYALLVSWLMLPETKDRTLLEIEEELTGKPLFEQEMIKCLDVETQEVHNFNKKCNSLLP